MNLKDTLERLEEMKEFQRGQAEICQEHGFPCSSFRYDPDALESAITLLKRYSEALEELDDTTSCTSMQYSIIAKALEESGEPTDEFGTRLG